MTWYLDTSVYGGYYDDEFTDDTRALFKHINACRHSVVLSPIVEFELIKARKMVKDTINRLDYLVLAAFTEEMEALASYYIETQALPRSCHQDAKHIAFATLVGKTSIISWNFKHMVNARRISDFNVVNLRKNYRMINIFTPKQIVAYYEKEKSV